MAQEIEYAASKGWMRIVPVRQFLFQSRALYRIIRRCISKNAPTLDDCYKTSRVKGNRPEYNITAVISSVFKG